MKVIFDTNIWISFLLGHQTILMQHMLTDMRFDTLVCNQLIDEIINVASREKFKSLINHRDLEDLIDIIHAYCILVNIDTKAPIEAVRDPKDLYLLSLAESTEANYIISGDKDLTDLKLYKSTHIIRLADFKQLMNY